jgi:hypothetical protein
MMTRISAALIQPIADAMTLLHPGWQIPGCKALLREAADLAPAGELARAALAFAEAPGIRVPSLDVFRDPSGPWWNAGTPEHARIVRPSDLPRCQAHRLFLPCASCAADAKADAQPVPVVTPTRTYDQHDVNARGIASVRAALTAPRRVEDEG